MSVANVAAVDAAVIAVLAADAELLALVPDGVYLDVAPADKTRFVIVQAQTHEDIEAFGPTALYEEFRYRITARVLESTGVDANAAAARIHALLHDADLEGIAGYTHMQTLRVERIKATEVDAIDNDIRWQHAGGDYEITVSPGAAVVVPPVVPYAEQVIADGASHYWRLGDLGGTIAIDEIGFAHGTISGGVTLAQPGALADGDTAMVFNGTTGKIDMAATVTIPVQCTIEVWFKGNDAVDRPLVCVGVESPRCYVANKQLGIYDFTYATGGTGGSTITDGVWHHVAYVLNGATALCYLDGVFNVSLPCVRTASVSGAGQLGCDTQFASGTPAGFWLGSLDDIAIYPRALTAPEIAAHYTAGTTSALGVRDLNTNTRKGL
jgi:hypothetical protein